MVVPLRPLKTENVKVKLTAELHDEVIALAAKRDVPKSQIIREALRLYLKERES
jgi:metal-responsive CopG/Arc/MetJ family transcriptional regulator